MPNTPTKRPHSHISVPTSSSSNKTTNHGISSNPFEAFMHMFDRNFHRSSQSAQKQHDRSSDYADNTKQSSTQPVAAIQHCQQSSSSKQSRQAAPTEYDNMLRLRNAASNNTNNNVREGLPSKVRNISTSSSIRTVSTSSTVRTTSASSPTQHCHDDNITSPPAVSTTTATSCVWRKAICPHTSKTYYWNIHTRESRWKKPLELASAEEREAIQSKERKQRAFFESMERNILKRLENGHRMKEMQLMVKSGSCDGGIGGGADRGGSEISLDNYNATNSGGIESSWTHAATTSPTENGGSSNSNANEDWIAGWITPTSESSFQQQQQQKNQGHRRVHTHDSPAGSLLSLNSMEGLSVLYPSSTSNQHEQQHQHGSLSPVSLDDSLNSNSIATSCASSSGISREERDDKVNHRPHNKNKMMSKLERIKSSSSKPVIDKPNLIRTISKMEHDLLARQLNPGMCIQVQASNKRSSSIPDLDSSPRTTGPTLDEPLTPTTMTCDILSSLHLTHDTEGLNVSLFDTMCNGGLMLPISPASPLTVNEDEEEGEEEESTPPPTRSASSPAGCDVTKPTFTKRNTCGTIYLGSTLSAPDKDALIKCVCGVFRAHLLQSERSGNTAATTSVSSNKGLNSTNFNSTNDEDLYAIFNDRRAPGDYRFLDITSIPSLTTITDFYRSIFLRSQMEIDCIIISLIYIERLIKLTDGRLTPSSNNWRSILFSCMVLASKVWDDLSMWNCDFSKIGPGGVTFSLARTNELEIALLKALEYKVKVNASEYAKYYFLLRGMLCRSGLANDDMSRLQPLDAKGAATLAGDRDASANAAAGSSDNGTANNVIAKVSLKDRSKSYGHAGVCDDKLGKAKGETTAQPAPQMSPTLKRVSLEQLVKM